MIAPVQNGSNHRLGRAAQILECQGYVELGGYGKIDMVIGFAEKIVLSSVCIGNHYFICAVTKFVSNRYTKLIYSSKIAGTSEFPKNEIFYCFC